MTIMTNLFTIIFEEAEAYDGGFIGLVCDQSLAEGSTVRVGKRDHTVYRAGDGTRHINNEKSILT